MSDVFSWLRGLNAGNWTGNAAYAHPAQVRLWPLALDVIEAAQAHIPDRDDHSKSWFDYQEASQAFCAAAERERA